MKGQGVGEAPVLVPTDTLLQLIQIRVSKTGRLNLQASQQYRDCCQDQSLTLHTHTHCSNLLCANQVPPAAPHRTPLNSPPAPAPNYQPGWDSHPLEHCTVRVICLPVHPVLSWLHINLILFHFNNIVRHPDNRELHLSKLEVRNQHPDMGCVLNSTRTGGLKNAE